MQTAELQKKTFVQNVNKMNNKPKSGLKRMFELITCTSCCIPCIYIVFNLPVDLFLFTFSDGWNRVAKSSLKWRCCVVVFSVVAYRWTAVKPDDGNRIPGEDVAPVHSVSLFKHMGWEKSTHQSQRKPSLVSWTDRVVGWYWLSTVVYRKCPASIILYLCHKYLIRTIE